MFLFCKNKKFWTNFSPFITSKVVLTKPKIEIQIFDIFSNKSSLGVTWRFSDL